MAIMKKQVKKGDLADIFVSWDYNIFKAEIKRLEASNHNISSNPHYKYKYHEATQTIDRKI